MTPEGLETDAFAKTGEMTHETMTSFIGHWFMKRTSWLIWLHHAMSAATFAVIVIVALEQDRSLLRCVLDFVLATATLFLIILPLHEALHAVGYWLVGARDIRWDYSLKMMAVWVIAHRFVATTRPFLVAALAPFVVLNTILIAAAILVPSAAVYLLFVLLWHLHGAIGDFALMNFIWLHRDRGFWTYDDAEAGKSYFYGRPS